MPTNYPPGVTDHNFDELCWGETYRLGRHCESCHEPIPDQIDGDLCDWCDRETEEQEEEE